MAVHPNSLKNLKPGRAKGSKNKKTLAKKDIETLIETTEEIKAKSEQTGLSKDDLVEVLVKSKQSSGMVKPKNPVKIQKTVSEDININPQDVEIRSRKVTLKEFFFGIDNGR